MKILFLILTWLFLAITSKIIYYKYRHKAIDIKYLILDWLFISCLFLYFYTFFGLLLDNILSDIIDQNIKLIVIILFLSGPIIISYVYWYLYKKYFKEINSFFALEIFILFLVIPVIIIDLLSLIINK